MYIKREKKKQKKNGRDSQRKKLHAWNQPFIWDNHGKFVMLENIS